MQISNNYTSISNNNQQNNKQKSDKSFESSLNDTNNGINDESKLQNSTNATTAIKQTNLDIESSDKNDTHTARITYGLKVLELMSDEEYRAFLWASKDLSESQKMLMAQSLYRFTDFYKGKIDAKQEEQDSLKLNAQKAFGIESSMTNEFINRYKNAYAKAKLDILP